MIENLILTALFGVAWVMLLEKWEIDDYMNTHRVFYRFWPGEPCLLCRAFWFGCLGFVLLVAVPYGAFIVIPFAAIPLQSILQKLTKPKI
jgi:hypothetical protein